MNYKRKSRRRFFLLMRSRTPPIPSEFRGGFELPKPHPRYATGLRCRVIWGGGLLPEKEIRLTRRQIRCNPIGWTEKENWREISGFHRGVTEVFTLLRCYVDISWQYVDDVSGCHILKGHSVHEYSYIIGILLGYLGCWRCGPYAVPKCWSDYNLTSRNVPENRRCQVKTHTKTVVQWYLG